MLYQPLRFFMLLGCVPFTLGFVLGLRWLVLPFYQKSPRTEPPILAAILILIGFQLDVCLVADLMAANRKLMEEPRCGCAGWMRIPQKGTVLGHE